jgi:hypothetical protein
LVAPFSILRVGGLPFEVLQDFVTSTLSASLEDYITARNQMRTATGSLVAILEQLVRQAGTDELRNRLIQLKRDIYNHRAIVLEADLGQWLEAKTTRSAVDDWQCLQQRAEQHLVRLTHEAEQAYEMIDSVLARCWEKPSFQQGVSIASPSLSTRMSQDWQSFKRKKRKGIARSLFAYATRAAAKTSPFSTLTSNCILSLDDFDGKSTFNVERTETLVTSVLNRSIPTALRNALLARHGSQLPINYHLSPHVRIEGNKIIGVSHRYQPRLGILWLEQYPIILNLAPGITEVLRHLASPFSLPELEAALRGGTSEAEAKQIINELVCRDIIRSGLEWNSDCANPANFLADILDHSDGEAKDFGATLRSMDLRARSFSTSAISERGQIIRRINSLYRDLHGKLSQFAPPEIRTAVYENAWIQGIDFQAGKGFERLFQRLGKAIHDKIGVSSSYIWLRTKFIEQYGEGGVCDNVPHFIMTSWRKVHELLPGRNNNSEAQATDQPGDRFAGVAREHISVPLTLFVQIVGHSLDELDDAEPKIVLNLAYNRIGWQTVRWCDDSVATAGSLQKQIGGWLIDASAPRTPVSIAVSSESCTLQAHPRCTERMLVVDGTLSSEDLQLSDLILRHNPQSNLLEITTRDHVPVQTHYLGALNPTFDWGPRYLAILMGEPFEVIRPPLSRVINVNDLAPVRHQERVEDYGCVLIRETWWVKSSELFRRFDHSSTVDRLVAARDFCDEFNIPRHVYAKGQISSWTVNGLTKVRKPVWLDFQNVACLDDILDIAKEVDWIILMEALPGPGENVLKIEGQEYVSEFVFEVVYSATRKGSEGMNHNLTMVPNGGLTPP